MWNANIPPPAGGQGTLPAGNKTNFQGYSQETQKERKMVFKEALQKQQRPPAKRLPACNIVSFQSAPFPRQHPSL